MYKSEKNAELAALFALKNAVSLKALGCRFERAPSGTVCVIQGGRAIGSWWYEDATFNFAPVAHKIPEHTASTVEELVKTTASVAIGDAKVNPRLFG